MLNPSDTPAICQITLMDSTSNPVLKDAFTINARSRYSLNVDTAYPDFAGKAFPTKEAITNDVGIVAERSMCWDAGGVHWAEGTCSLGKASVIDIESLDPALDNFIVGNGTGALAGINGGSSRTHQQWHG